MPHRCANCGKLAKIGTPGTVRIPYQGNMIEFKAARPLCSHCIGSTLKWVIGHGPKPKEQTVARKPSLAHTVIRAASKPRKWTGKRH